MVDIKEKLEKGYLQVRVLSEVVGRPKEHVNSTTKAYIERLKQDNDIEIISHDVGEPNPVEKMDGFFGAIIEMELLFPNLSLLTGFCFDYMPSSVEVIEPQNIMFKDRELSSFFNELQNKLHSMDMIIKQSKVENQHLVKNTQQLLENVVTLMLMNDTYSSKEMAGAVGLPEDQMEGFLNKLLKKGKVKEEEGKYSLVKDVKREKQD